MNQENKKNGKILKQGARWECNFETIAKLNTLSQLLAPITFSLIELTKIVETMNYELSESGFIVDETPKESIIVTPHGEDPNIKQEDSKVVSMFPESQTQEAQEVLLEEQSQ